MNLRGDKDKGMSPILFHAKKLVFCNKSPFPLHFYCLIYVSVTMSGRQNRRQQVEENALSLAEIILVIAGLSINVYLIAQKDGAMIRQIQVRKLLMLCVLFFAFESLSMMGGYGLTKIRFFTVSQSEDLRKFCYFCAVVLFLIIAAYMLWRSFTDREIDEHLAEINIVKTVLQALMVAVFAFICGIGWGFIGHNIYQATGVLAAATVIAVLAGITVGYHEGCKYRKITFAVGGAMLLFAAVEILIRCL